MRPIPFAQTSGQGTLYRAITRRAASHDVDAIHRTGRQTQATTRTFRGNHRVHQFTRADDGIDGAGGQAQGTADTGGFINDGRCRCCGHAVCRAQWQGWYIQQQRQFGDDFITTWRALIDRGFAGSHGFGIRPAAGVIALAALGLRQQCIDGISKGHDHRF